VAGDGVALLVYAALAAPVESLATLEDRLSAGIPQAMDAQQLVRERSEWLGRPASMAFPVHRFRSLLSLAGHDDYLLDAQAAFERGNHTQAQAILENVRSGFRAGLPPSDIMIDALLPEVQLLTLIAPSPAALAGLDSTLRGQRFTAPNLMADVARAGMLVRAMAWRAELAAQTNDSTAARMWAEPVLILWSGADSYLNATLRRMSHLTAR
jgi:hypothetical protein